MGNTKLHLQLPAAALVWQHCWPVVLLLLLPALVHASTFNPIGAGPVGTEEIVRPRGMQASARAAATAANFTCNREDDWLNKLNVNYTDYYNFVGRWTEGQGWYVAALQANREKIAKAADPSKVLMCLVGGGCPFNGEDEPTGMTGCEPGPRPGNPKLNTTCRKSWRANSPVPADYTCPMAAMMAAPRNGGSGADAKGMVGIWPGAQLHMVNSFQDDIVDPWTSEWLEVGYTECLAEFRTRRAAGRPDLKLMIFTQGVMDVAADEPKVKAMIKSMLEEFPNDLLLFSQLYGDFSPGEDTYTDQNFPATDPAYMAVGSVDERGSRKPPPYVPDIYMSGTGPAIDFVGPAWQVLTYAFNPASGGMYPEGYLSTEPDITPADYPNMLQLPRVQYAKGDVTRGPVTAGLVDCGDGTKPCAGAKGKICMVDWFLGIDSAPLNSSYGLLGHIAHNCVAGGGVGVIVGNNAETDQYYFCNAALIDYPDDPEGIYPPTGPGGLYPTTVLLSRRNWLYLKQANAEGKVKTVTIRGRWSTPLALTLTDDVHVAAGGAMAAMGMVWSAHPSCTGAEVRKAVELTATNKGKWNNETGWGMPQALNAHEYLLANPCEGGLKLQVGYELLSKGHNGKPRRGSSIRLTVTLTSAGKPVSGKAVTIVMNEPWVLLACKTTSRSYHASCKGSVTGTTNAQGSFIVSGKLKGKGGKALSLTVWAETSGTSGQVTSEKVTIPIAR